MPDVHTDSTEDRERRYTKRQPQCWICWQREHPEKSSEPVPLSERRIERCSTCGHMTMAGIYVEVDLATVPYPSLLVQPDGRGLWAELY
jgi:hypothetical protein